MERNTFAYKARRKMQALAFHIVPHDKLACFYAKILTKKKVNLDHPTTFNEKIMWCKLYYYPRCRTIVDCTDKYKVREYVKKKGLEEILTPFIGKWENARDICWDNMPEQFMLKCNHGCAYNIAVQSKKTADRESIIHQLNKWLKDDFSVYNVELHYAKIKPRLVIAEQYLGENLIDYKFFCFEGVPKFMYVSSDLIHDRQAKMGFFYIDGKKMELRRDEYEEIDSIELPPYYDKMIEAAKKLAKDFHFVRVDFFVTKDKFYFAELTFTPGAGVMYIEPEHFDKDWGAMFDISDLIKKHKQK